MGGSRKVVYAALAGNLAIAATKGFAAWYTGSSAMTSEAIHSLVDTGNQALLLYGMWRAARPPDESHPLGHGRELYFWSFIVAVLIFSMGAGMSILEGWRHLRNPDPIANPYVAYGVLAASLFFEGISWSVAMREFSRAHRGKNLFSALTQSKDPSTFTVLFEDSAAVAGLLIALVGTVLAQVLGNPRLDGWASIGIGSVLAATAVFLARESKGLLIGERARPDLGRDLCKMAADEPGIASAREVMTVHLAPDQVVAALDVRFHRQPAVEVAKVFADLEHRVRAAHPEVIALFLRLSE